MEREGHCAPCQTACTRRPKENRSLGRFNCPDAGNAALRQPGSSPEPPTVAPHAFHSGAAPALVWAPGPPRAEALPPAPSSRPAPLPQADSTPASSATTVPAASRPTSVRTGQLATVQRPRRPPRPKPRRPAGPTLGVASGPWGRSRRRRDRRGGGRGLLGRPAVRVGAGEELPGGRVVVVEEQEEEVPYIC